MIKLKLSLLFFLITAIFFSNATLTSAAQCCIQQNLSSCILKTDAACSSEQLYKETDCNAYPHICPQFICCTAVIGKTISCLEYQKGTFDCTQGGSQWNTNNRPCSEIIDCQASTLKPSAEQKTPTPTFEAVTPKLQIDIPSVTFTSFKFKAGDTVSIPWIMEYIKGVYKYLLGLSVFLAIIMVTIAGFRWMTSGGNASTIGEAKKQISGAIVGLILAFATNVILSTINPELIQLKGVPIQTIATQDVIITEDAEGDIITEGSHPSPPSWNATTFDCNNPPVAAGVADPRSLEQNYTCPGVTGQITSVPEMKPALCRAGQLAGERGYSLEVKSSYRSFEKQVNIWCGKAENCYAKYPNPLERRKFCAVPGFSNHGIGRAVDVTLKKNGQPLYYLDSTGQCAVDPTIVAAVAKIFYDADPLWKRYEAEIWHFEYGTDAPARSQYTTLPAKCRK